MKKKGLILKKRKSVGLSCSHNTKPCAPAALKQVSQRTPNGYSILIQFNSHVPPRVLLETHALSAPFSRLLLPSRLQSYDHIITRFEFISCNLYQSNYLNSID